MRNWGTLVGAALLLSGGVSPALAQSETAASAWTTACSSQARDAPVVCIMEQPVILSETGQRFASLRITSADPAQPATLILQLPLGLAIQSGVALQVDALDPVPIPLTTCEVEGCFASTSLGADLEAALKAGSTAIARFENLANQAIEVEFSLVGFTAAYDRLQ